MRNYLIYYTLTPEVLGNTALVSCSLAGMSRSVTITCAYLMSVTSLDWPEVLDAVRFARPHASPNFGFCQQLMHYHKDKIKEERERVLQLFPSSSLKLKDEEHLRALLASGAQGTATKGSTTDKDTETTGESLADI